MEEQKGLKTSLSTFFLILAIIVMVVFLYIFYNQKIEATKKSAELQTQVNSLNETVNNLQDKINSISDTINSNVDTEDKTKNTKNTVKLKFDGVGYRYPKYAYEDNNGDKSDVWEYVNFIFNENGKVEYVDFQSVFTGTYKIVNDKIECDFQKFENEHGDNSKGEFDKDITLTLISDDKIIGSVLEKKENSEDGVPEFYWGPQKVVFEFNL